MVRAIAGLSSVSTLLDHTLLDHTMVDHSMRVMRQVENNTRIEPCSVMLTIVSMQTTNPYRKKYETDNDCCPSEPARIMTLQIIHRLRG